MNPSEKVRFLFATVLAVLIGLLGVLGVAVTLFSPHASQADISYYFGGLFFSSIFLVLAYVIWLWGKRCGSCSADNRSQACDLPPVKKNR